MGGGIGFDWGGGFQKNCRMGGGRPPCPPLSHYGKPWALQGAFLIEFLKNFILRQHEASAEKKCQIVIISHNSAQFEKLNTCIVCYIINHQNS